MKTTLFAVLLCVAFASLSAAQDSVTLRFPVFSGPQRMRCLRRLAGALGRRCLALASRLMWLLKPKSWSVYWLQLKPTRATTSRAFLILRRCMGIILDLRPWLGDELDTNFRYDYFGALRTRWHSDEEELHGYPDALGVVAPFVNTSLFERAGVALPAAGASWDEWLAALDEVVEATDAPYVLSVDNKDHRLVGPAMSLGARYFNYAKDFLELSDADGLRDFLMILYGLMEAGKTPADTLLGTGKSQEYFVRGETVMYICGSWKAEEVAEQVGGDFDWAIVPNPSGPGGRTGVAEATALAALAQTEYPDAVAKVFAFLLDAKVGAEFAARTLTIPAREDLAASGIDYQTDSETVAAALNAFAREGLYLQDQAIALLSHRMAPFYFEESNRLLRAFFAGEIGLDKALADLKERLDDETVRRAAG